MDTYGDMVTLLLCFFVLLYSMSTISEEKWMMIVQSFNNEANVNVDDKPLGPDGTNDAEMGDDMPMTQDEVNELQEMILEYLAEYSAGQESSDSVSYSTGDGFMFISFSDDAFFGGNSYQLTARAREVLGGLCPMLEEMKPFIDEIRVSGHTATAQKTYDPYFDWRLSAERAAEVSGFLYENTTIQGARITCEGNGQWLPVAGNVEESERSKNRRVEIRIALTDQELDSPFDGSVAEYYSSTNRENPNDPAGMTGGAE